MSLSSTTSRNDYTGNGSVSTYSYNFKVFLKTDLLVTVADTSTPPVQTTLTCDTDYTVSGVGSPSGGSISFVNSGQAWLSGGNLKSGYRLTVRRVRPLTQTTDIRNQGSFYPEVHEDTFDHLVMLVQQIQDQLSRAVINPETLNPSTFNPTLPTSLPANAALVVNPAGTGLAAGVGGSGAGFGNSGSRLVPIQVTAGGGIPSPSALMGVSYVMGSGGAVTISAAQRIASGVADGQVLAVVGCDNTNTVTLDGGGNLIMNGPYTLAADSEIVFRWDGSNWRETARNGK